MEINLKCLPYGNLPYEDVQYVAKMMAKLYEHSPYLSLLPKINDEDIVTRTINNIPGIKSKDNKLFFKDNSEKIKQEIVKLDAIFNAPTPENLENYKIESVYLDKFISFLKKLQPKEAIINILGPVSLAQMLTTKDNIQMLSDKYYRKFIVQAVCVKALWAIAKIKEFSPESMPIIVLEEPLLYKVGDLKRENEDITKDTIVNMLSKTILKIKEYQAAVAIQSFSKCDWSIPIEAGADIISFDAYNNPNNLNIIAEKVNNFLLNGGKINWAIVPTDNENLVKSLKIDDVLSRFIKTVEGLISSGVNENFAYSRAMVSIQGDVDHLPVIFAEKAIIIANQLSKKIPNRNYRLPQEH